jgi:hypothetical protein
MGMDCRRSSAPGQDSKTWRAGQGRAYGGCAQLPVRSENVRLRCARSGMHHVLAPGRRGRRSSPPGAGYPRRVRQPAIRSKLSTLDDLRKAQRHNLRRLPHDPRPLTRFSRRSCVPAERRSRRKPSADRDRRRPVAADCGHVSGFAGNPER